jgi:hypothetical protein
VKMTASSAQEGWGTGGAEWPLPHVSAGHVWVVGGVDIHQ